VRGAYAFSATCPPVNAPVHMEITLPQISRASRTLITGKMRAQRVEHDLLRKREIGFSVTGKGFTLRAAPVSRQRPTIVKARASKKKRS